MKLRMLANVDGLNALTNKLIEVYTTQTVPLAAHKAIDQIRENSSHGLDPNGHPYKEYAKSTIRYKKRHGLPIRPRTLRNTEQMLTGLDLYGNTVTVRDKDQDKAYYNHFGSEKRNLPASPLFEVGTKTLEQIEKDLAELVNRLNF